MMMITIIPKLIIKNNNIIITIIIITILIIIIVKLVQFIPGSNNTVSADDNSGIFHAYEMQIGMNEFDN